MNISNNKSKETTTMKVSTSKSSVITQILIALAAIVMGYLLLFNTSVQIPTLCQLLCGAIVADGIASIASYFLAGDYKRIDRYGFAVGTMLVLMGLIGLIRIDDVTAHFDIFTGLVSLVLGVLVVQGTIQMKILDYSVWILNLIIALVCLFGAFCVLSEITVITGRIAGFSSWILLICGVACLLSMLMTWICIMMAARREKKIEAEKAAAAEKEEQARIEAQEQARKEEEEKARQEEVARKEALLQARKEELARRKAEAQARREETARKEAQAGAQTPALPDSKGQGASGTQVSSASGAAAQEASGASGSSDEASSGAAAQGASGASSQGQIDLPPLESPELVFGGDDSKQTSAR